MHYRAIIHVAALSAMWTSSEPIIRRCTSSALDLAAREKFASVAMPLIGSGTGGVSEELALRAIEEVAVTHSYAGRVVVVRYVPKR